MLTNSFSTGLLVIILLCIQTPIYAQVATACAGAANGTFVRNSESCRAFYYCADGIALPNMCPENFLFEPVRQICDIPSRVDCTGCSLAGVQHIAHPNNCTQYYVCVAGIRTLRSCGNNLLFDRSLGDCNIGTAVKCVRDPASVCSTFQGFVRIGDPSDCTMFFTCFNGVSYHQSCAAGLYFNPAIAACSLPLDYNFCQDDSKIVITPAPTTTTTTTRAPTTATSATTTSATTTTTKATTTPTTTTTRAATTTTTKTTTTTTTRQPWTQPSSHTTPFPLSEIDSLCVGEDGYYPIPGSCQDYVYCLRNSALLFRCDTPWYWNQIRQECSTIIPPGC